MLTPLIALAGLRPERNEFLESIPKSFQSLEGTTYDSKVAESPIKDIEALIVSVFIAWGLCVFFRRKSPRKKHRFMGPYPF